MSPIISFAEDPFLFCFLPSLRIRDHILLLKCFTLIACVLPQPWHPFCSVCANTAVSVKNTVFWNVKSCS
jgi:hypothetical protein